MSTSVANPDSLWVGKRFGSVVVTAINGRDKFYVCDCGNTGISTITDLNLGKVSRCRECSTRMKKGRPNLKNRIHGTCYSTEYNVWRHMIQRCTDPETPNFADYGGRGIKVCERWLKDVRNFISDMGERPTSEHQLDRRDNDGPYSPDNCRWATRVEQCNNTRRNRVLVFNGKEITMAELARISPVSYTTLRRRLNLGWTVERAIRPVEAIA